MDKLQDDAAKSSETQDEGRPRPKGLFRRKLFWILLVALLAIGGGVGYWVWDEYAVHTCEIRISYETTRITGPLKPDGTVDYAAALDQEMSAGVTKDNNAAVLLIEAYGPAFLKQPGAAEVLRRLDIQPQWKEGEYFITLDEYIATLPPSKLPPPIPASWPAWPPAPTTMGPGPGPGGTPAKSSQEVVREQFKKAHVSIWSAKDYPVVADWLAANEKVLATIITATHRSRFYFPAVRTCLVNTDEPNIGFWCIHFARALSTRAMLKVDGGDAEGATTDLLVVHRMARLVSHRMFDISYFCAGLIESYASRAEQALAASGKLTSAQARALMAALKELAPLPSSVCVYDKYERYALLDEANRCARGQYKEVFAEMEGDPKKIPNIRADWNKVMVMFNARLDRCVKAMESPTYADRTAALKTLDGEFTSVFQQISQAGGSSGFIDKILGDDDQDRANRAWRRAMAKSPGECLFASIWSLVGRTPMYEKSQAHMALAKVALALAAHKADKGGYPDALEDLVPTYIEKVPTDPFSDKPLRYRTWGSGEKTSYLLWSVGENGVDEGGSKVGSTAGDDIVVMAGP